MPGFLFERNEGGVSNYGIHRVTIVPYTLAFLLCGIFILQAVRFIPRTPRSYILLRYALCALACLLLIGLTTTYTYKINTSFKNLHVVSVILIFCFEMAMAIWISLVLDRNWANILLLAIQALGFTIALLTYIGTMHLLFVSQIITSLAFGVLLVLCANQLVQQRNKANLSHS
jgi:hypothetical protein